MFLGVFTYKMVAKINWHIQDDLPKVEHFTTHHIFGTVHGKMKLVSSNIPSVSENKD